MDVLKIAATVFFLGLIVAFIAWTIMYGWKNWRTARRSNPPATNQKEVVKKDIYINEFWWSFGFRPIVCSLAGAAIASLLWLLIGGMTLLGIFAYNFITMWFWLGITTITTLILTQNEEDDMGNPVTETVPEVYYGAVVTWRGMVVSVFGRNVIRTTGTYHWTGKVFRFGRTSKTDPTFTDKPPTYDDKNPTEETKGAGFINLGKIPVQIWNNPGDRKNPQRAFIRATSSNLALIIGTMTLNLRVVKPYQILNNDDATLKVADRARQEFRELCEIFVDSDIVRLMKYMEQIMRGKRAVTCFLPESVGAVPTGSMIRNRSGKPMIRIIDIPEGADEATVESLSDAAMIAFAEEVKLNANGKQLKAVETEIAGIKTVSVSVVYVSSPITEMIAEIGCVLDSIIFGDIDLSPPVTAAANQASAEMKEREAEMEDALTRVANRKVLLPTAEELANAGFELAQILESQRSGNKQAQVVYAAGTSNPLVAPAVAAASIIQGTKP